MKIEYEIELRMDKDGARRSSVRGRFGRQRDVDREGGAAPGLTAHRDRSRVGLCHVLHDGEAEADALCRGWPELPPHDRSGRRRAACLPRQYRCRCPGPRPARSRSRAGGGARFGRRRGCTARHSPAGSTASAPAVPYRLRTRTPGATSATVRWWASWARNRATACSHSSE